MKWLQIKNAKYHGSNGQNKTTGATVQNDMTQDHSVLFGCSYLYFNRSCMLLFAFIPQDERKLIYCKVNCSVDMYVLEMHLAGGI